MKICQYNLNGISADLALTTLIIVLADFNRYWPGVEPKLVISLELKGIVRNLLMMEEAPKINFEVCHTIAPYDWFVTAADEVIEEPVIKEGAA